MGSNREGRVVYLGGIVNVLGKMSKKGVEIPLLIEDINIQCLKMLKNGVLNI